ncbi:hypothetical protein EPO34_00140 [Patescibacteria group bacterium]|nr:MAG: hypothetical protein EPO34_00140 [Patescibacteria group bacterium]
MAFEPRGALRAGTLALAASLSLLFGAALLPRDGVYVSPDEMSNAFFAHRFAATGTLTAFEPLNAGLDDAMHPRSVVAMDGQLAPGGFLGLPALYGGIMGVLGTWALPLITPILAFLAVFAWSAVVSRAFGRRIGFVSALVLALHPAWLYYTARSLMPNVPFVAFLILSAFAASARPLARRFPALNGGAADLLVAGSLAGLALAIRPSELLWLVPSAFAAWFVAGRVMPQGRSAIAFFAGVACVAAPMLALNALTYGSPLSTGYPASSVIAASAAPSAAPRAWERVQEVLRPFFPFGIHPRNALRAVLGHGLLLFWWLVPLSIGGAWLSRASRGATARERPARRAYHAFFLVSAAYLAVLYGSWVIHDNPDPDAVSIANSYVRYWLPAFALSTPYVAAASLWLVDRAVTPQGRRLVAGALAAAGAALALVATAFAPGDGLLDARTTLARDAATKAALLSLVEPDAVVIVDRADKLLFPERRVRVPLRDEGTYALMPRLVLRAPLYYFGITLPQTDLEYLNGEKLEGTGLRFVPAEPFGEETLYRIEPASAEATAGGGGEGV